MTGMTSDLPHEETPAVIEEPEAPHHHAKSGIAWLDIGLALAVLALSGASLLTAQHTGHTMEKLVEENSRLVRANATPVLQFESGNVEEGARVLSFTVSNVGSGTARVIWFELRDGGKAQRNARTLIGFQTKASDRDYVTTRTVANRYLPAGEARTIIRWPYNTASADGWQRLDRARVETISAAACFCSVLGECWESALQADQPKPVASCDSKGHTNFEG
jgi:hypothetical protein